jgi:hypothetical protein
MQYSKDPRRWFQVKRSLTPRPRNVLEFVQFWRISLFVLIRSVWGKDLKLIGVSSFWQLIAKGAVLRVAAMAYERSAVFKS